jgi:CO/xanthine dehydrogenase Mo-binding subunit
MSTRAGATRREFLKGTGALVIYFAMGGGAPRLDAATIRGLPVSLDKNPDLDSWLRIDADASITIFSGKAELGQGIRTALAQIAAEELEVELSRVRMAGVDTAHSPDEAYTFGSVSVQHSGAAIRHAAAQARGILVDMAAELLDLDRSRLSVADGRFLVDAKPVELDYWRLLGDQRFECLAGGEPEYRPPTDYRFVGHPTPRLDIPGKVFGEESFIQDLRLDGMVHARIVRPNVYGAQLRQADVSGIGQMDGVIKVVRDGSFLGVVAEQEVQALAAARAMAASCTWEKTQSLPIFDDLTTWLRGMPSQDSVVAERNSNAGATVTRRVMADYSRPYQAHASISPSAAVALLDGGNLTVWSHGQGMYPLRGAIARVVGLPEERVRCIHMEASGCYGQNGADDAACDAALLALAVPGRAVRLQWSRQDEFRLEPYGSAMSMRVEAGLDAEGRIAQWNFELWSTPHTARPWGARGAGNLLAAREREDSLPAPPAFNIPLSTGGGGDRNAVPLYNFPQMKVTKHFLPDMPLRVSALRSLGAFGNVFAIESFMDELALMDGNDPLAFRRKHLTDPRADEVLKTLGDACRSWNTESARPLHGRGIGFARYENLAAYVAVAMFVRVGRDTGVIRLLRAVAAVDTGRIINPDGVRAQIEGAIVQAASWTLKEQVRFNEREILTRGWASYPILGFDEIPDIEVLLIEQPDQSPVGVGEAAQGPTAAAIANAVANATGLRLRNLPLTPERLRLTSALPGSASSHSH